MNESSHFCLSMLEAWPIELVDKEDEKMVRMIHGRYRDYGFILGDEEFGCEITAIGDHNGYSSSGLTHEIENAGMDFVIEQDDSIPAMLLEWVRKEFEEAKKKQDEAWSRTKPNRMDITPIRLLILWQHTATFYPAGIDWGEEVDAAVYPVSVFNLQELLNKGETDD